MKTLYLHIGTVKTGSTSIQTFLEENTELLRKYQCVYPMFPYRFENKHYRRNGAFLDAIYKDTKGNKDNKKNREMVDFCLQKICKLFKSYETVILSDEVLFWNIGRKFQDRIIKLLETAKENDFQIEVIVYLRRQSDLIESQWNQAIKQNSKKVGFEEHKQNVIDSGLYNYSNRLDCIAELFGKDNITVRRFQKEDLIDESSVADFLQVLGIDCENGGDNTAEDVRKNTRISDNMAFIKRYINLYTDASGEGTNIARTAFTKASEGEALFEYKSSFMSVEEKMEFMNIFKGSNDKVASEYLKDGRPLFNNDFKDLPKWEFNNPAILEDVIKSNGAMFGEVINVLEKQDKRIKELERTNIKFVVKKCIKKIFH